MLHGMHPHRIPSQDYDMKEINSTITSKISRPMSPYSFSYSTLVVVISKGFFGAIMECARIAKRAI